MIAVNKMDLTSPPWSRERYEQVQAEVGALLQEVHFDPRAIRAVPISGRGGDNLVVEPAAGSALRKWYRGPTLMQVLDDLRVPARVVTAPLRAIVTAVVTETGKGSAGVEVSLSVLRGRLRVGRSVGIATATAGGAALTVKRIVSSDGSQVGEWVGE